MRELRATPAEIPRRSALAHVAAHCGGHVSSSAGPRGPHFFTGDIMAKNKQTIAADVAVLEGDDVPVEQPLAKIPVSRSELYHRLDEHLRREEGSALLAVRYAPANPFLEPVYEIFEAQMKHKGTVSLIDIVKRAKDLGILGESESPIPNW